MTYKTPAALEMAVSAAARKSSQDTGKAVAGFYFHRPLCRVFSEKEPRFVLKGGLSTLARVPDARSTRDVDLTTSCLDIDEAVEELKRLASADLGDFLTYRFEKSVPIRTEDEYREGRTVSFTPVMGAAEKQRVSVDLVVAATPFGKPEIVAPADRLDVNGLKVYDYAVYPIAYTMADKICAMTETHGGRESSRVKDLVDLAIILSAMEIASRDLADALAAERMLRKLGALDSFSIPQSWHSPQFAKVYAKLASETSMPDEMHDIANAEKLVKDCVDPILSRKITREVSWNPRVRAWSAVQQCEGGSPEMENPQIQ